MKLNQTYLAQLRSHINYGYYTEDYVNTEAIELARIEAEDPKLRAIVELFKDVYKRDEYAKPFREVIQIYLGRAIPHVDWSDEATRCVGSIVLNGRDKGLVHVTTTGAYSSYQGNTGKIRSNWQFIRATPELIDKYWATYRLNRIQYRPDGEEIFASNGYNEGKFNYRAGLVGCGRFKRTWIERGLEGLFNGPLSAANTMGLTKQGLYDIIEQEGDDAYVPTLILEVLLEQITAEAHATEA